MHVAIVEDDVRVRARIVQYIEQSFEHDTRRFQVDEFSDGDEILENYRAEYDLVLLDIQMARLDGMKTAEKIRSLDENVYVAFVTNMAQYAIRGYSVNALDFILKPVNYLMVQQLLQRVETLLNKRTSKYITLPTDHGLTRLDVSEIDYIETEGHTLIIYTEKMVYRLNSTMKNMESQLENFGFYRCNNCYLVNLAKVERVNNGIVYINGHQLAVSRPRHKGFMDALVTYIGGVRGYHL